MCFQFPVSANFSEPVWLKNSWNHNLHSKLQFTPCVFTIFFFRIVSTFTYDFDLLLFRGKPSCESFGKVVRFKQIQTEQPGWVHFGDSILHLKARFKTSKTTVWRHKTSRPFIKSMASRHTTGRFGPLATLLRLNCMRSGTENLKTQLAFLILLHDFKTFFAEVPKTEVDCWHSSADVLVCVQFLDHSHLVK